MSTSGLFVLPFTFYGTGSRRGTSCGPVNGRYGPGTRRTRVGPPVTYRGVTWAGTTRGRKGGQGRRKGRGVTQNTGQVQRVR